MVGAKLTVGAIVEGELDGFAVGSSDVVGSSDAVGSGVGETDGIVVGTGVGMVVATLS